MNWEKQKVNCGVSYGLSASTIYCVDGYRIWKGKYCVVGCIYSADEWHLQRMSDKKIIFSARTAKECKEAFEKGLR